MACLKPVPFHGVSFHPCGRCVACRRGRQAVMVSRLLIEGLAHERVSMVTLTYRPERLPAGETLVPEDLDGFLKRFRINYERACARDPAFAGFCDAELLARTRLRFFGAGEYGGRFGRPHFHLICYGADRATVVNGEPLVRLVHRSWAKGSVHIGGGWSGKTAAYVSGYLAKGHNVAGLDVLGGRHPEFSRWPTRPGLGVPGLRLLLPSLLEGRSVEDLRVSDRDLRSRVEVNDRDSVLGAFLMWKARELAGLWPMEARGLVERSVHAASISAQNVFFETVLNSSELQGFLPDVLRLKGDSW